MADGLAGGWAPPAVPELPEGWEAEQILARGLVAAFLHVRPALACAPPTDAAVGGTGLAEPADLGDGGPAVGGRRRRGTGGEARAALVAARSARAPGRSSWPGSAEMDLPDPEAVLADPASFLLPERGDRAYAALAAVAAAVAADPTADRWAAGWQVLGLAADSAPDVAAVAARVLARCRPDGAALPAEVRLFAPVLRDAGLLHVRSRGRRP